MGESEDSKIRREEDSPHPFVPSKLPWNCEFEGLPPRSSDVKYRRLPWGPRAQARSDDLPHPASTCKPDSVSISQADLRDPGVRRKVGPGSLSVLLRYRSSLQRGLALLTGEFNRWYQEGLFAILFANPPGIASALRHYFVVR